MENSVYHKEEDTPIKFASDTKLEGVINTWESRTAVTGDSQQSGRGANRHSIRFNSQTHLGHSNLMHWPRLGNGQGAAPQRGNLGVVVDNTLP